MAEEARHREGDGQAASLIRFADRRPFALAVLRDRSYHTTGITVESCTIITIEANELLVSVPHDRMPAILDDDGQEEWLDLSARERDLRELLVARLGDEMELVVTSSEFVVDDARCIEPWRHTAQR